MQRNLPDRLLTETEWRQLGVQQSRGWVHYAIHKCVFLRVEKILSLAPGPVARTDRSLCLAEPTKQPPRPARQAGAAHPALPPPARHGPDDGTREPAAREGGQGQVRQRFQLTASAEPSGGERRRRVTRASPLSSRHPTRNDTVGTASQVTPQADGSCDSLNAAAWRADGWTAGRRNTSTCRYLPCAWRLVVAIAVVVAVAVAGCAHHLEGSSPSP